MKRVRLTLLIAALVTASAIAHEGHDHKLMGTVSSIHEKDLVVKGTDGKTTTISLNEKTRILRGKSPARIEDILIGQRVVITATQTKDSRGQVLFVAKEVRLGIVPGKGMRPGTLLALPVDVRSPLTPNRLPAEAETESVAVGRARSQAGKEQR